MTIERQISRHPLLLLVAATMAANTALAQDDLIFMSGFGSVTASITHPGDGTHYAAGASIPFVGSASENATLVWTSNIDGQIGTGSSFSQTLSLGDHMITLTATTADPETAKAQIEVFVDP